MGRLCAHPGHSAKRYRFPKAAVTGCGGESPVGLANRRSATNGKIVEANLEADRKGAVAPAEGDLDRVNYPIAIFCTSAA